jgi:hypothetical protein
VEAVHYLDEFLRWPRWIDDFDPRWGLGPLALLERARAKQGANDVQGAEADYVALLDAWEQPDPRIEVLLLDAQNALESIRDVTNRSNDGSVAPSNSRR